MTITSPKIRPQPSQINRDHADGMRGVDEAQDALLATYADEVLEREADAGVADDGFEDGDFGLSPLLFSAVVYLYGLAIHLSHRGPEPLHELLVGNREVVLDPDPARGRAFLQRGDGLADRAVDGVEVEDGIAGGEGQVAQDGVDAGRGVLDEDAVADGRVEVGGDGVPGGVEGGGLLVADEGVGARLGERLVFLLGLLDGLWVCAEGAWDRQRVKWRGR